MSVIAITGATGQLGRLVVENLLESGIPAGDVVAVVRTPGKAADLAERGVQVREGDYDRPDTLTTALAGVDVLLLVSGSEPGGRVAQHTAVIRAAENAGVDRIVYTSLLRADTSPLVLAPEHKATEEILAASALPTTILRNGWYTENYTARLGEYLDRGVIVGATGDGLVAAATRADYAAAAAVVLTTDGHEGAVYELGGTPFTLTELAAVITEVAGRPVTHQDVSVAELRGILTGAGLDEGTAGFVAALDEATAQGALDTDSTDLARLIGRPTTPLADAVRAAR
ncbi:SDR family oxidoreductase [Nakamurella flavida]|uniref:SDR family oxidoreductase n=1 Tax=Nakamurella flavida TaxID=363630 RepID=A0A938YGS9_9ACTN|nr:SDR family oxidoreductase [Nakamurella flavida]MBM9475642.1 SDR family oxidoreductase [Nakamurella flavida]MDP9778082.1 NAD(P)H dehydrogenase (quinone) [Nakamurella flavida]